MSEETRDEGNGPGALGERSQAVTGAISGAEVVTLRMPLAVWEAWRSHTLYLAECDWLDDEIRAELLALAGGEFVVETRGDKE